MEWIEFDQQKWADQPLPPARKHLLVQIAAPEHLAVGQSRLDGVAIRCRHLQSGLEAIVSFPRLSERRRCLHELPMPILAYPVVLDSRQGPAQQSGPSAIGQALQVGARLAQARLRAHVLRSLH